MDTMFFEHLADVNYFAVIIATVASFVAGWIWYSKPIFGKVWMKEVDLSESQMKKSMAQSTIGALIFTFISALVLATFLINTDWIFGIKLGGILGAGIGAATLASIMVWEQKSWNLILIHIVFQSISFMIMGAIIGLWQTAV